MDPSFIKHPVWSFIVETDDIIQREIQGLVHQNQEKHGSSRHTPLRRIADSFLVNLHGGLLAKFSMLEASLLLGSRVLALRPIYWISILLLHTTNVYIIVRPVCYDICGVFISCTALIICITRMLPISGLAGLNTRNAMRAPTIP